MARTNGQIAKSKVTKWIQVIIFLFVLAALVLLVHRLIINYAYPTDYSEYVEKWSSEYNVDKALVYSIIKTESDFDAAKKGGMDKNKYGLMQIDNTEYKYIFEKLRIVDGDKHTLNDMTDPDTNIKYGVYYLKMLEDKFGSDKVTLLAAFYEGPSTVEGWLKVPEYSSDGKTLTNYTGDKLHAYVKKVQSAEKIYKKILGEEYIWQII